MGAVRDGLSATVVDIQGPGAEPGAAAGNSGAVMPAEHPLRRGTPAPRPAAGNGVREARLAENTRPGEWCRGLSTGRWGCRAGEGFTPRPDSDRDTAPRRPSYSARGGTSVPQSLRRQLHGAWRTDAAPRADSFTAGGGCVRMGVPSDAATASQGE